VVLPANFRVDAWVIPPAYTGKPPIVLPGIHPGETAAAPAGRSVAVPVNSTLVVRSTGKANVDVTSAGGVTPAKEDVHAPAGTQEHRFKIVATGFGHFARRRRRPDLAVQCNPRQAAGDRAHQGSRAQNRGSLLLSYRLEDDYGVTEAAGDIRAQGTKRARKAARRIRSTAPPDFALILPQARTRNAIGPDHQGSHRSSPGPAPT